MSELILVVEDELALQETLTYNLERQGYRVEIANDGREALGKARKLQPDLIVLDVMLPTLDGFEVCRILRQELKSPILMLTARDDEIDRVIGLEMGADDYITKPFSMREFLARVKAHLRRERRLRTDQETSLERARQSDTTREEGERYLDKADKEHPKEIFRFGNLAINMTRWEVLLDDQPLSMKPKEFELLVFLARHRGQVLSRELILERVWGWDFSGGSRTVDVHVRWLREKVEKDPANPLRIVTVRGAGYRFEG